MEYGGSDGIYGESDVIYELSHIGNGQQCAQCAGPNGSMVVAEVRAPILLQALMLVNTSLAC